LKSGFGVVQGHGAVW